MKFNHRFVQAALFSLLALSVNTAYAQTTGTDPTHPGNTPCPHPFTITLPPASGNFVNLPDMPATWNSHAHQGIGGTAQNTFSGFSFDFRKLPGPCCQVTSARLTVTFKALQGGPCKSATSANDLWAITHAGSGVATGIVPAASGLIFPCPTATGQTVTKVVTVTNPFVLSSGFLSIFTEDDTEIVSATLVITGCCVNLR